MSQELQNCLAEASMCLAEANGQEAVRIAAALGAGKFVVVCDSLWHCRSTDAVAGVLRALVAECSTRDEAEAHALTLYSPGCDDRYMVLPVPAPVVQVASTADDCPF